MSLHEDRKAERMKDPEFARVYDQTMNGLRVWSKDSPAHTTYISPEKKLVLQKSDEDLTLKTEVRDETCWCYGCDRPAVTWVREVQYDMKGVNVDSDQAIINTRDYDGPVPGFCRGHDVTGSKQLAEAVYTSREEFKWGAPATRWFVIFTDGTKLGGGVEKLDLPKGSWVVTDEHTPGASH